MALGKNKKIVNLVQSISEMKEENYAAGLRNCRICMSE